MFKLLVGWKSDEEIKRRKMEKIGFKVLYYEQLNLYNYTSPESYKSDSDSESKTDYTSSSSSSSSS